MVGRCEIVFLCGCHCVVVVIVWLEDVRLSFMCGSSSVVVVLVW